MKNRFYIPSLLADKGSAAGSTVSLGKKERGVPSSVSLPLHPPSRLVLIVPTSKCALFSFSAGLR